MIRYFVYMLSCLKRYILLAMPFVALTSGMALGQDSFYKANKKSSFTIGFRTGREILFHSLHTNPFRGVRHHNEFVFRKPINNHFKLETGLSYNTIQNNTTIKGLDKRNIVNTGKNSTAIPLSLQYYFIPAKSKVSAYCGAGVQCNIYNRTSAAPFNSNLNPDRKLLAGTKYINVLITQGITFQINTRIQLNQSFHFIPGADTAFGINLGIGYDIR